MKHMRSYDAIYVGVRRGNNVPLVHVWQVIGDDGKVSHQVAFGPAGRKKTILTGKAFIGDIYTVEETTEDGETFSTAKKETRRRWENASDIADWSALARTAELSAKLDKESKKGNSAYGELSLNKLRDNYCKLIGRAHRACFLAMVNEYITS